MPAPGRHPAMPVLPSCHQLAPFQPWDVDGGGSGGGGRRGVGWLGPGQPGGIVHLVFEHLRTTAGQVVIRWGSSNSSNVAAQGVSVVRRPVRTCSEVFGDSEAEPEGDQLALLPGSPGFEQGANQFEQGANTLPNQSDPLRRSLRTIRTTPPSPAAVRTGSEQQGQTLFIGSGADAADDGGDDPAWPTRQDMQEGDHAAA